MKISEVIERLTALKDLRGDMDVIGYGHNAECLTSLIKIMALKFEDCEEWYVELDCDPGY